ncbi:hypothetical protein NQ176_g5399 [Zarea fungicola]|uniref:Uncharacterized protein n=1 Tax=Zarea fungicola TaxID=93591 RepID=A0ACC1N8Q4_9HYPO|nr:hypothetical protein NQ176_g5399 [Lecanicillium fungicola]
MSFHEGASNIRVDDGHILRATLRNNNGEEVEAELDLDQVIGNNNARFQWGSANFSQSAKDISFSLEGGANVPILRANLGGAPDEYSPADVNLAERIRNDNGALVFN